jgi:hypothetical protein
MFSSFEIGVSPEFVPRASCIASSSVPYAIEQEGLPPALIVLVEQMVRVLSQDLSNERHIVAGLVRDLSRDTQTQAPRCASSGWRRSERWTRDRIATRRHGPPPAV